MEFSSKKLLVLDVNGLLVDTYFHKLPLPKEKADAKVGNFYVFKRPFCEDFLQFCLENFVVGIWSSAREHNVNNLIDYVFGDLRRKLAFSWHQLDCTDCGLKDPENKNKPVFLKELSKLWERVKPNLPWSKGDYGPSNTLLIDDTPYKAIFNPPNTGIFPRSYIASNSKDDFLGYALRDYLKGIRDAVNIQIHVENNPFGEPGISAVNPHWSYFSKILPASNLVAPEIEDCTDQLQKKSRVVLTDDIKEITNAQPIAQYCSGKYSLQHSLSGTKLFGPHVTCTSVEKNIIATNGSGKHASSKQHVRKDTLKSSLEYKQSSVSGVTPKGEGQIPETDSWKGLKLLVDAVDQASKELGWCRSDKQRDIKIVDHAVNGKPCASRKNSCSASKRKRKLQKESVQCSSPKRSENNNKDHCVRENNSSLKVTHNQNHGKKGFEENCSRDGQVDSGNECSQRGEAREFNPCPDSKGKDLDIANLKLHETSDTRMISDCSSIQRNLNQKWDLEEQGDWHKGEKGSFKGHFSGKLQSDGRVSETVRKVRFLEHNLNHRTWGSDEEEHNIWSSGKHGGKSYSENRFNLSFKDVTLSKYRDAESSDLKQWSGWSSDQEGSPGEKWEGKSYDESRFGDACNGDRPGKHHLGESETNLLSSCSRYAPHHAHHKYLQDDKFHSPEACKGDRPGRHHLGESETNLSSSYVRYAPEQAQHKSDLKQQSGWSSDSEGSPKEKWEGKLDDESRFDKACNGNRPAKYHLGYSEMNLLSSCSRYAPHHAQHKYLQDNKFHSPEACKGDRPGKHHLGESEVNLSSSYVRYAPLQGHYKYLQDGKFHSPEGFRVHGQASKETRQMNHHVRGSQRKFYRSFVGRGHHYHHHNSFQDNDKFLSPMGDEGTKQSHHRRDNGPSSRGKDEWVYGRQMNGMDFNRDQHFDEDPVFERSQNRYCTRNQPPRSVVNIVSMNSGGRARDLTWQYGPEAQSSWNDYEKGFSTREYVGNSPSHSRFRHARRDAYLAGSTKRPDKWPNTHSSI